MPRCKPVDHAVDHWCRPATDQQDGDGQAARCGFALDDAVLIVPDADGVLWAKQAVEHSGNCTIRIIPAGGGRRVQQRRAVLDAFASLGVDGEGMERFGLVALNVPGNADIAEVKRIVVHGEHEGRWHYEEGCVTPAWRAAGEPESADNAPG